MNRNNDFLIAAGLLAAFTLPVCAADDPTETRLITGDEIKWVDNPMRPGAKMAVIEGDPQKPGPLIMRLKLPPDFKIPPHWHPAASELLVGLSVLHRHPRSHQLDS